MKKSFVIIAVLLAILLLSYEILWHNSFDIALSSAGFSADQITVLDRGDAAPGEYRVVAEVGNDGYRLLALKTNKLGWWTTDGSLATYENMSDVLEQYGWINHAGSSYYEINAPAFIWEQHTVYCGSNAQEQIRLLPEQLPNGVSVKVLQAGKHYLIHFMSHGEPIPTAEETCALITEFCSP